MMSTFLDDLPSEAKRRLLLGWLPILVVIVLLCVFGGFPPTSWGLTLRFLALGSALKTVQADTVSQYFNDLLIQSVCTLIAWLLVILAIVSEVFAFKSMQTQLRISRLQAKLSVNAPAAAKAAPAPTVLAPPTPVAPVVAAPPPVVLTPPPDPRPVAPAAVSMESASLGTLPVTRSYGVRVTVDDTPDEYPANPFVSKTAEARSTKNRGVQISPNQQNEPDPFDVQEEETIELFDKKDSAKDSVKDNIEEPVFVFGNPFEGELPEVFTYDKDLQKAVEGLRITSARQSSDKTDSDEPVEEGK